MAVTGRNGQIARSLALGAADAGFEIATLARPRFDLAMPETIGPALAAIAPDIVVSAAAYTAVDRAETEAELAMRVNRDGPAALARAAAQLDIPILHISTDYVFDGEKGSPYLESDPVAPLGTYGRSKLAGEQAVAAETADFAILRTSWVYSSFGATFVKTMLKLAATRERLTVVDDQFGRPSYAPAIATGVFAVARHLLADRDERLRGVFHLAGGGEANWFEFAEAIMAASAERGGRLVPVEAITTAQFPTLARRPRDSRLDCRRIAAVHGVELPDWRRSLVNCIDSLMAG